MIAIWVLGDVRATEAMFRDIDVAVGNRASLRTQSLLWGATTILLLAGFTVLTVELRDRDSRLLPSLAIVGLIVFSTAWVIEAAFHASVTTWAVSQLENGAEVPALFHELKRWLNLWVQILVNPLALLAYIGLAVASMRTGVIPSWAGWIVIVWSALFLFFPLPLAIAPIAVFFGAVLFLNG